MQDPRDLALRALHDRHSHNNAIRVAFARLYRRAVPTARLAAHYDRRLPSVQAWVAARLEREQSGHDEDMLDAGAGTEPEPEPEPEPQVEAVVPAAREKDRSKEKEKEKEKGRERERAKPAPVLGKRKAAAGGTKTATATAGATKTASAPHPARTTRAKQRRTEVERLIGSGGRDATPIVLSNSPSPPPPPATTTTTTTTAAATPAPAEPKKTRPNTRAKRTPAPNSLQEPVPVDYEILPYVPGMTEVIVNRYPLFKRRRGDDAVGARLDTARLGLMCMKAAGQKTSVKAGAENSVLGGVGELVFLRRNKARVKKRLGTRNRQV